MKAKAMVTPYEYQKPIIRSINEALQLLGRALMVMASGTGKTICSAFIVRAQLAQGQRCLFLCHNNTILEQARKEYRRAFGKKKSMATFTGETKEDGDFVFASFQTMHNWKDNFSPDEFDMVVVDESHHSQAETFRDVIEYFEPTYLLGMTATPDRMDGREIREIFGEAIDPLSLEQAISRDLVAPIAYRLMTIGSLSVAQFRKIFREVMEEGKRPSVKQLNRTLFIEKRDEEIAVEILKYPGQGIIFCESVLHAEQFAKHLPKAEPYHSKRKPEVNATNLKRFRQGELSHLLTVDKFNEGIDIPDAEVVIFLRSTDSLTIYLQQLGRGLRLFPGKQRVTVLDFVANVERLEYVQDLFDRIGKSKKKDRKRKPTCATGDGYDFSVAEEVLDILALLQRIRTPLYETYTEASAAAQRLGITSSIEYWKRYREDLRLPSHPQKYYKTDWKSWLDFLDKAVKNYYETYAEASVATKKLKIKSCAEYEERYREDLRLSSSPKDTYKTNWISWPVFLGTKGVPYKTYAEALRAVRKLKIRTSIEYHRRYKEAPRLPSNPHKVYKTNWISWPAFLGTA